MDILELLKEGSPTLVLLGCVLLAVKYLVIYINKQQEENRADIKDMQTTYRTDISDLLDSAKDERKYFISSIEGMNTNTNKAITELNKTVGDLTYTVNKMEILIESKLKK
tara:strand:+ start:389 stop:718 length:330 start_codon:yes stop_codon:yes gene_type:complete